MGVDDSGWLAIDIRLELMRYVSGDWRVDVVTSSYPGQKRVTVPITSGRKNDPVSQSDFVAILECLRQLVSVAITQIVEPF